YAAANFHITARHEKRHFSAAYAAANDCPQRPAHILFFSAAYAAANSVLHVGEHEHVFSAAYAAANGDSYKFRNMGNFSAAYAAANEATLIPDMKAEFLSCLRGSER